MPPMTGCGSGNQPVRLPADVSGNLDGMSALYTKNGVPLTVRGDRLFNPSGQNFGYIRGDRVFGLDGRYRGTMVNDRVVYRSTHSARSWGRAPRAPLLPVRRELIEPVRRSGATSRISAPDDDRAIAVRCLWRDDPRTVGGDVVS